MAKAVRALIVALVLAGLVALAWPWLTSALYAMRLASMPAPTALAMPVATLNRKALNDTWHASRPPARGHEGIDIFAKTGTPVISSTEGIVLSVGQNKLGGNVVWVMGPAGHRHYYAHLDRFADIEAGDRVRQGTLLGYVGNTGNARTTPPHLHYGIYTTGGAINPFPLLMAVPPGAPE